jgi:prephenate dehydrogenase
MTKIGGSEAGGYALEPCAEATFDRTGGRIVDQVVIVGVGLMGGSLGMALIQQKIAHQVIGIDSAEVLEAAVSGGAIHSGCTSTGLQQAVETADLIVLATPIHTIPGLLRQIAPYVQPHAAVTDVASVKTSIVKEGERLIGNRFVGGHPMAGSEQTGIHSARSNLFHGAAWALTPSDEDQRSAPRVESLCKLIRAVGASPLIMGRQEHDRAAALISHLPHLICYAYNQTVSASPEAAHALSLAAGSYRDLTRIVASDPVLWRDVFIENRAFLLETLRAYKRSLAALEAAVETGDPEWVLESIVNAGRKP